MKFSKYTFRFKGGGITVFALNYEQAKILAQAEAIKKGWDYKIINCDNRLPSWYAEVEYDDFDNPEAIEGAKFDDMNYLRYTER